jgi:hypothetical protein
LVLEELRAKLSVFPSQTAAEDTEARVRIAALEEWAEQHGCAIAIFKNKFTQLSAHIGRLAGGMLALSNEVHLSKGKFGWDGGSGGRGTLRGVCRIEKRSFNTESERWNDDRSFRCTARTGSTLAPTPAKGMAPLGRMLSGVFSSERTSESCQENIVTNKTARLES